MRGTLSEMILHCGHNNEELKFITKHSLRRQADLDYAVSPQTKQLLKDLDISLISWKKALRHL